MPSNSAAPPRRPPRLRAPTQKSRAGRKRGRPSSAVAVDRRQKLLDSARILLGERGSARLTLGEVARKAGVDAAMVKYYFGS